MPVAAFGKGRATPKNRQLGVFGKGRLEVSLSSVGYEDTLLRFIDADFPLGVNNRAAV